MKKTILVVEDFESIRNFVRETLEKKGYATIGAADGNEAFEVVKDHANAVNLVLSDYNMPNCTGLELLHKIKANSATSAIPVIFLTTESDPGKMKSAKEAGLSAWVRKPYKAELFFAQIENIISNGQ
ncbi:MAG TPA: response regulator [Cyclobacteriaceae bacterium]|nr:response regulator [Cyclobacteriaceae bacterium]